MKVTVNRAGYPLILSIGLRCGVGVKHYVASVLGFEEFFLNSEEIDDEMR